MDRLVAMVYLAREVALNDCVNEVVNDVEEFQRVQDVPNVMVMDVKVKDEVLRVKVVLTVNFYEEDHPCHYFQKLSNRENFRRVQKHFPHSISMK